MPHTCVLLAPTAQIESANNLKLIGLAMLSDENIQGRYPARGKLR